MIQQELKDLLHYDQDTGIFTWLKNNKIAGTLHHKGAYQIAINKKIYLAHRLAWLYMYGEWPNIIDHINGNPADNKIINLRNVTTQQNNFNRKFTSNTSGIKGVCWDKNRCKWKASIMLNKKQINLGRFTDLNEAKLAVESARIKYHGEYANHG